MGIIDSRHTNQAVKHRFLYSPLLKVKLGLLVGILLFITERKQSNDR